MNIYRNCIRSLLIPIALSYTPNLVEASTTLIVDKSDYSMTIMKDGVVIDTQRVIVGRKGRETPSMVNEVTHVVINPSWTVPKRIKRDITRKGTFDNYGFNIKGDRWVQPPGPDNVLGRVKFRLTNDKYIYIHGSNQPYLFSKQARKFSSGCIRVEDEIALAKYLLPKIDIDFILTSEKEKWILIEEKIEVIVK